MSIEQLKKCFTTGNYRDALAIGESLLNDTTLTDDQNVMFSIAVHYARVI